MNEPIEGTEWFEALKEDCNADRVETTFSAAWDIIAMHHRNGQRILTASREHRVSLPKLLQALQKSYRTAKYEASLVEKFPDLNSLPDGKNTNWSRIINTHLTETHRLEEPKCKKCTIHCLK